MVELDKAERHEEAIGLAGIGHPQRAAVPKV
jgi:hypothetical protein